MVCLECGVYRVHYNVLICMQSVEINPAALILKTKSLLGAGAFPTYLASLIFVLGYACTFVVYKVKTSHLNRINFVSVSCHALDFAEGVDILLFISALVFLSVLQHILVQ